MTVCIAAACDNGERIVTATDGLLSTGDATGESVIAKMLWFGPWQFMYAGIPASFALVTEEIESTALDNPEFLSRRYIQRSVRAAYQKVLSRMASFEALAPLDFTLDEFKQNGLQNLGNAYHKTILQSISHRAGQIYDQILVTGWGHAPHSAMVYEIGPVGDRLHDASGFAAIGSGAQMAQTMLLLLGQGRHRTLGETIFNVACAKFSSEKSTGLDVGRNTTMHVSRKCDEKKDPKKHCGEYVSPDDIDKLRRIWEEHLKPRIPDEARVEITRITASVTEGKISPRDMIEHMHAAQRMARAKREASRRPRSTKAGQSRQQPLREKP